MYKEPGPDTVHCISGCPAFCCFRDPDCQRRGMDVSCCCGTVRGIKQRAWHGPLVLLQPPPDGLRGCLYDTPWSVRAFLRYGVPVLYRPAFPQMADRGGGVKWGTSRYGT